MNLMLEDIERLSGSISGILSASKIERGRAVYRFSRRDLAEFIEKHIEMSAALIGMAEVHSDLDQDCFCKIDEPSMTAVMNNLVGNAVRYSPAPASITIALRKQGDRMVLISVTDEGEGVAKKDVNKIFKMFYRASQRHVGTGIGLYSVKQIVKAHKGKVWAQSPGQGQGTTVNVLLPRAKTDEE